jgi:hypothetical protein
MSFLIHNVVNYQAAKLITSYKVCTHQYFLPTGQGWVTSPVPSGQYWPCGHGSVTSPPVHCKPAGQI